MVLLVFQTFGVKPIAHMVDKEHVYGVFDFCRKHAQKLIIDPVRSWRFIVA
jgi:hypothetical protein